MSNLFDLDEKAAAIVKTASAIAGDVLAKNAQEVDEKAAFPKASMDALAEAKLYGLCVPSSQGGLGFAPRVFAAVTEELATKCSSTAMIYVMHVTAAAAIASSATLGRKSDVLKDIAAGKHLTTLAFSEKGSRSHFWAPVSKLEKNGANYKVRAFKSWVTSANYADSYVSSSQGPDAASPMESVIYLMNRKTKGVNALSAFNGLGLRGNDSAPVQFEDADVPASDLISPLGEGAKTMLEVVLPWFSMGTSAMATGLCRAATDATAGHLGGAKLEHLGSSLRDFQVLRARLAEMATATAQARCLLAHTVKQLEAPAEDTPLWVLQTRMSSLQTATHVTDLAMKAGGGAAFSKHLPLERLFRDARAGWVMAPTVDHLGDFIGKALTGLPLF